MEISPQQKKENAARGLAIAKTFPDDVPVFFYAGHGSDNCDPVTRKPLIAIVPENCIYITISN